MATLKLNRIYNGYYKSETESICIEIEKTLNNSWSGSIENKINGECLFIYEGLTKKECVFELTNYIIKQ